MADIATDESMAQRLRRMTVIASENMLRAKKAEKERDAALADVARLRSQLIAGGAR